MRAERGKGARCGRNSGGSCERRYPCERKGAPPPPEKALGITRRFLAYEEPTSRDASVKVRLCGCTMELLAEHRDHSELTIGQLPAFGCCAFGCCAFG